MYVYTRVISVYFNIRNTLPKFGTFLLGHPVYILLLCVTFILKHFMMRNIFNVLHSK